MSEFVSVSQAVAERHSVRAFRDTPVDPTLLREILTKALRAPSNSNIQPWLVHLVTGETLARLKAATAERAVFPPAFDHPSYPIYPDPMPDAQGARRFDCGERQYGARGIARDDREGRLRYVYGNHQFFGAPAGLFLFADPACGLSQWADMGIFLQTLMLLLNEAGLDSCAQISWAMVHETVRRTLGIGPEPMLYCGLAIGYADASDPINSVVADRAGFDDVVTIHT
jgi:nitroreductase